MVAWKYVAFVLFWAWVTSERDARGNGPEGEPCFIAAGFLAFYALAYTVMEGFNTSNLCAWAAVAALWAVGNNREHRAANTARVRMGEEK